MPIIVVTGQPGNGKTLYMMEMLEAAYKEGKRPIYVHGVKGTLPDLVHTLDDASDWESVPDGSLIFVDEAWKKFGHLQDARGAPTPNYVQQLAVHRHRGIDFVMTTQMVNQLYPFMRGLVGEHIHVSRKFGTGICTVYKWGELCEDVKSPTQRERALSSTWAHPSRLFGQFESATVHTIKRKIPWRIALIPICLVGALLVGWWVYASMKTASLKADEVQGASGEAAAPASTEAGDRPAKKPMTVEEWAAQFKPRVLGIHGSQPLFDGRKVKSEPATYCMISGQGIETKCRCYTEQVTPITDVQELVCRAWAKGGLYDPFRAPFKGTSPAPSKVVAAVSPTIDRDLSGLKVPELHEVTPGALNPNMRALDVERDLAP